jgi:hypothetical protein
MSDNMSVLIKIDVNKHGLADVNRSPVAIRYGSYEPASVPLWQSVRRSSINLCLSNLASHYITKPTQSPGTLLPIPNSTQTGWAPPRNRQILRTVEKRRRKSRHRFSRASTGAAGVGHALASIPHDHAGPALSSVSQSLCLFVRRARSPSVALFACRLPVPLPPLGLPTLFSLCLAVSLTLVPSPLVLSPSADPDSDAAERRRPQALFGRRQQRCGSASCQMERTTTRFRNSLKMRASRMSHQKGSESVALATAPRGGMPVVCRKGRLGCSTIVTTVTSAGQAGKATGGEQGPTRRQEAVQVIQPAIRGQ